MRVGSGDTAMLTNPIYSENLDRVCKVITRILDDSNRIIWFCQFREKIRTNTCGMMHLVPVEDFRLTRLAGPCIAIESVKVTYKRKRHIVRLEPHGAV